MPVREPMMSMPATVAPAAIAPSIDTLSPAGLLKSGVRPGPVERLIGPQQAESSWKPRPSPTRYWLTLPNTNDPP